MRRKTKIGVLIITILVLLGVGIGAKVHMDKESRQMALEKQASIEIKERFKNIKKIKITDFYESSPGTENIDFDVVEINGKLIKGNSTTIGDFGSYSENGLTSGVTKGGIKVVYTTGKEAIIK